VSNARSDRGEQVDCTRCQAVVDALYEAAVEALEHPRPFRTGRQQLDDLLRQRSHAFAIDGWEGLLRERDRYKAALEKIARRTDDVDSAGAAWRAAEARRALAAAR
jgi:hypothetical protein